MFVSSRVWIAVLALVAGVESTMPTAEGQDTRVPEDLSADILGRQIVIPESKKCATHRKPKYPSPSGAKREYVIKSCSEGNVRRAINQMSVDRQGSIFFECGKDTTIRFRSPLVLRRYGNYKIVNRGRHKLILHGRRRNRIIDLAGRSRLELYNIAFHYGRAPAEKHGGGAILAVWLSTIRMLDCEFLGNVGAGKTALSGGGAIHLAGGGLYVWDSMFAQNQGPTGGAIHTSSANLRIYNSVFLRNFVTGGTDGRGKLIRVGGAVRSDRIDDKESMPVRICGCHFEDNDIRSKKMSVADFGSAIAVWGHPASLPPSRQMAQISRTDFVRNGRGGTSPNVIMCHGAGNVRLSRLLFLENQSTRQTLRLASSRKNGVYSATMTTVVFKNNREPTQFSIDDGMNCAVEGVTSGGGKISCA